MELSKFVIVLLQLSRCER